MSALSSEQHEHWQNNGWILLEHALPPPISAVLDSWVASVARPASNDDSRLHYFERTEHGRTLCRTERFIEDHAGFEALTTRGVLRELASELVGEPAVLYKEKINYKLPDGAGFAPHQDATAYAFVRKHVTCLVAIDVMTVDNGCLEFARFTKRELLADDGDGCISPTLARGLEWQPVPMPAGAVLFFTSHVPHRSGPNRTGMPRRALYLTYNAASEGDRRHDYYQERDRSLAASAQIGGTARISTIGHFLGRKAD